MRTLVLISLFLFSVGVYGQVKSFPSPTFKKLQALKTSQSYTTGSTSYYSSTTNNNLVVLINHQTNMTVQQRNQIAMRKMQPQSSYAPTQAEIRSNLERKKYAQYQQQLSRQEQQRKLLYAILNENNSNAKKTYSYAQYGNYRFADSKSELYTQNNQYYEKAYEELNKMLKGEQPLSVKKAIYHSENALYKGSMPYDTYSQQIEYLKSIIDVIGKKYKLDLSNELSLNFAIQKLYTDTIINPQTNKTFYPLTYDFNDIFGDEKYTQSFVSKLLMTGKGQCHSMPLLYKILADEYSSKETYMSYSPMHSYIQFKDSKGNLINFEATNGSLTTDAFVVGSGFVKSEALLSQIYMDTVNTKQLIAQLMVELATMYKYQIGNSDFMDKCISTALKYYPNCIQAYVEKSNLETAKLDKALFEIGYPSLENLENYPEQYKQFNTVSKLYDLLDKIGYTTMPKEAYEKWLKDLEKEKQKQENESIMLHLNLKKLD